jgi:hypothetical protein
MNGLWACWTCLDLCGPARTGLDLSGPVWTCLDLSGPVWTCLDLSGPVWTCLDLSGPVWTCLDRSCQVQTGPAKDCPGPISQVLKVKYIHFLYRYVHFWESCKSREDLANSGRSLQVNTWQDLASPLPSPYKSYQVLPSQFFSEIHTVSVINIWKSFHMTTSSLVGTKYISNWSLELLKLCLVSRIWIWFLFKFEFEFEFQTVAKIKKLNLN